MPELAAHLERVARELAHKVAREVMGTDEYESEESLASLSRLLAAALAACAREARVEAAKAICGCCANPEWGYGPAEEENGLWFHRNVANGRLSGKCHAAEIWALERAVGEKAAGEPK